MKPGRTIADLAKSGDGTVSLIRPKDPGTTSDLESGMGGKHASLQLTTFLIGCPNNARRHASADFTRMSRIPSSQ